MKTKTLFNKIMDEHGLINVRLKVYKDSIYINTEFQNTNRVSFHSKRTVIEGHIPRKMDRHHIAYHFDDPLNGTVLIPKSLHAQLYHYKRSVSKYAGNFLTID